MQNQNYSSRDYSSDEASGSTWLKALVGIAIIGLLLGAWLLFSTRSSTAQRLDDISSQLQSLETSSPDGLDDDEQTTLETLRTDLADIESKTDDLPNDTKDQIDNLKQRLDTVETTATGAQGTDGQAGQTGATGPQGPAGPAGADGTFTGDAVTSLNTLTDDLTLQGTTNQVNVTDNGTNTVTLGLPQNINTTANPQFNNLNLQGTLTIEGLLTLNDNANITGNLAVTGNTSTTGSLSFGTSITSTCQGLTGYIWVPGNPKFGTMPGFCVMQYEAKNDGAGNPVSTEGGTPWVSISQRTAQDESRDTCDGCHLITENEWMTIATDAMWQPENWSSGTVGTGCLFRGNVGNLDACGYDGADPEFGAGRDTKARLTLSNGNQIWDISGNVWEWTDAWVIGNEQPNDGVDGFAGHEYTAITAFKGLQYLNPTNRGWNATQGLGRIYSDGTAANNTQYGFLRGGVWNNTTGAGAFALGLYNGPTDADSVVGFRVAR